MKKIIKILILFVTLFSVSVFFIITAGSIVRHVSLDGPLKNNLIFKFVYYIASLPSEIKFRLTEMEIIENKNLKHGFHFSDSIKYNRNYFMLLSRYDLEKKRTVIELIDTKNQETIFTWLPNIDEYNKISNFKTEARIDHDINLHAGTKRHRNIHPLLLEDGSIITNSDSPLIRFNCKSELIWQKDFLFHGNDEIKNLFAI